MLGRTLEGNPPRVSSSMLLSRIALTCKHSRCGMRDTPCHDHARFRGRVPILHRRATMRSCVIALLLSVTTFDAARAAKGVGPVKVFPVAADSIRAGY